ncbi:uncharacterized protein BT62DRAFT_932781 [Guyanagaster necrorhizus]|uniref:Uncharacterized protein n=1 Tax=Guyanagaster necrorhizus TaxID=856835 RepID=A0A9P8ARV9_9AGAR|nr:uncharacterized protein BT62DRAFT_932781 [Guyanagaster necrorhizus MCA 3950]KAG7445624.1 hypothetical protein BT62DRAFT_932781 [Guyanagaster necrorhizus MCA 3950]
MAEDGQTIGTILRFCYPTKDLSFKDISVLYHVLVTMARKYLTQDVALRTRSELRKFCDSGTEPLRSLRLLYAIEARGSRGCRCGTPKTSTDTGR